MFSLRSELGWSLDASATQESRSACSRACRSGSVKVVRRMADQGALLIGTESSQVTSVAILAWMYAWAKAQASRRKAQASTRMVYQVNAGETLRGRDAATKSNPRAGRHVGLEDVLPVRAKLLGMAITQMVEVVHRGLTTARGRRYMLDVCAKANFAWNGTQCEPRLSQHCQQQGLFDEFIQLAR